MMEILSFTPPQQPQGVTFEREPECLFVPWFALQRQAVVTGAVEKVEDGLAEEYFDPDHSRANWEHGHPSKAKSWILEKPLETAS